MNNHASDSFRPHTKKMKHTRGAKQSGLESLLFALILIPLIFGALILGCAKQNKGQSTDGRVVGLTYTNSYFGASVVLPQGWKPADQALIDSLEAKGNSKRPAQLAPLRVLLAGHLKEGVMFVIMAQDVSNVPDVQTGKDVLPKRDTQGRPIEQFSLEGHTFFKEICDAPRQGLDLKQEYMSSIIKGHALTLFITCFGEDLEWSEQVIKQIHFAP